MKGETKEGTPNPVVVACWSCPSSRLKQITWGTRGRSTLRICIGVKTEAPIRLLPYTSKVAKQSVFK